MRIGKGIGLVVLVLAGLWWLPVEVPDRVQVPGKVLPARSWTLVHRASGAIEAVTRNHAEGTVEQIALTQFERGDAVRLHLHPGLRPGTLLAAGDTLATIASSMTQQEQAQLSGRLGAALATLNLDAAGKKPAVVQEAQSEVEQAQERVRQQQLDVDRLRTLAARALIPAQELELAESELRVREADVRVAQARLATVETGSRPQRLDLSRAEAAALRDEIQVLQSRIDQYVLLAPFQSRVMRTFNPDSLLTLYGLDPPLVVMPVPLPTLHRLTLGQPITVLLPGLDQSFEGEVIELGDTLHTLGDTQVAFVTARLTAAEGLLPGALVTATLSFAPRAWRSFLMAQLTGRSSDA